MMRDYYPTAGVIVLLPSDRIISRPTREPEAYTEEALAALIASIQAVGLLEPIRVCPIDEQFYRIVSGERRFRASMIAGLTEIPSIITEGENGEEESVYALIDDLQHEKIHYLDQAEAIRRLIDEDGYSIVGLSEALSLPPTVLSEKLRLLQLSRELRTEIRESGVSEAFAKLLVTADAASRRGVLDRILSEDLSLTEAEEAVRQTKGAQRRANIMVFKDLNVFVNTVEHAVETMNRSGIASRVDRAETGEYIEYTIRISKSG